MKTYMWNDELALGLPEVDAQHKEILNALRDLQLQLRDQVSDEEITEKLLLINQYRVEHFRTEEKLMEPYKDQLTAYAEHVAAHRNFANGIDEFLLRFASEGTAIAEELYEYLGRWLHKHIIGLDKQMGEELAKLHANNPEK